MMLVMLLLKVWCMELCEEEGAPGLEKVGGEGGHLVMK